MKLEKMNEYAGKLETVCVRNDNIAPRLYEEYGVNRGLRDENGRGVLTGLTNISKIVSSKIVDNQKVSCDGELWYRGYQVKDLINAYGRQRFGYERTAFLLLFGRLPEEEEFAEFLQTLAHCRDLQILSGM